MLKKMEKMAYFFQIGETEIMIIRGIGGPEIVNNKVLSFLPELIPKEEISFFPPDPQSLDIERWRAAKELSEARKKEIMALYK